MLLPLLSLLMSIPLSFRAKLVANRRPSSPVRLLPHVRLSQRRIEAWFAHATRFAALALCEMMAARRAVKFCAGEGVFGRGGFQRSRF
jgi:hypothetical protein